MLIKPLNNYRSGIELVDLKMNEGRETAARADKAPYFPSLGFRK
jgi:hypothetical protein